MEYRTPSLARSGSVLVGLLLLLAVFPPASRGQGAGSATLSGTVVDASGGVLPGATLTLTAQRTRTVRAATTDDAGSYVFAALTPGPYRLRVEREGFAPWESGTVHLSPGDTVALGVTLEVGKRTDEVTVTAAREMVREDQGAREGLITAEQIETLSIVSRSAMELLRILPGVDAARPSVIEDVGSANSYYNYAINGYLGTNINPVLDGSNIGGYNARNHALFNMNVDMVDEVKVQSGNYAAEFGSSPVQITAVTKSGSADFHGSVYSYWRNWRLAANDRSNNYADIPRPESSYLYPGFNVSGPLLLPGTDFNRGRDKLFFFVGFEIQRQTIDRGSILATVPTLAQRRGDFSELLTGDGENLLQPRIVTIPWGFPGAGQPAPNNDLSPYIDPMGQAFLSLYPEPNYSDPENRYNYAYSTPQPLNRWQLTTRLDWNISRSTHAYVRLAMEDESQEFERGVWNQSSFEAPSTASGGQRIWSLAANVTSVLSPSLTNEAVFSVNENHYDADWDDPSKVSYGALGLEGWQGVFPSDNPVPPMSFYTLGQGHDAHYVPAGVPFWLRGRTLALSDNLTKVKGAHTIRLGVFVQKNELKQSSETDAGSFVLASTWTPGATGNDYGDLLVGRLAQFSQGTERPPQVYDYWSFEGYIQDSWRVNPRLTLEGGVRLAKWMNPRAEGALRFEPSAYDPTQGTYIDGDPQRPNGILLASRGEIPEGTVEDPGLLVMPRLNFAWDVRGDGDLVLRGGTGLFHVRPRGYRFGGPPTTLPPNAFNTSVGYWNAPGSVLSVSRLSSFDGFGHLSELGLWSLDARSVEIPRTWNWSLALAKRLPWEQTLEVAYVGHHSTHLESLTLLNYIPEGALTGPVGNADLDNPLHRMALDEQVARGFRLFPAYRDGGTWIQSEAVSNYNGLQVSLSRQAGRHLQYFVNYSFSKALGTTGDDPFVEPINPRERSYGLLPWDRTHIFNASYNVLLPAVVSAGGNGLLRGLLNGWQVSGITRYASGVPFRITFSGLFYNDVRISRAWWGQDAYSGGQSNAGAVAPVFYGDPRTGNTDVGEHMLDIEQIGFPPLGESGPWQQPYDLRNPSRWNWDLTLFKNFPFGDGKRLQLRVGIFNLFNQAAPDYAEGDVSVDLQPVCNAFIDGVPNGAGGYANGVCDPLQGFHFDEISQRNFGKILTKRGHRIIELAARFDF